MESSPFGARAPVEFWQAELGGEESTRSAATRLAEGSVSRVRGLHIECRAPDAALGDLYRVESRRAQVIAEVIAVDRDAAVLMPYGDASGVSAGSAVERAIDLEPVRVSSAVLGRVVDCLGKSLDGGAAVFEGESVRLDGDALSPMLRGIHERRMTLGVREIDTFLPAYRGERIGIFSRAGGGENALLGEIAKGARADVVVVGLVGGSARTAEHFVRTHLRETLARSVVVVASRDRAPVERVRAQKNSAIAVEAFAAR
ncbi:MAG: hypothetical protein AAFQ82_19015, partial [Myxococcota bacterium]